MHARCQAGAKRLAQIFTAMGDFRAPSLWALACYQNPAGGAGTLTRYGYSLGSGLRIEELP